MSTPMFMSNPARTPFMSRRLGNGDFSSVNMNTKPEANPWNSRTSGFLASWFLRALSLTNTNLSCVLVALVAMRTKLSVCHPLEREREIETESDFIIYSTRSPGPRTPTADTRPSPTNKENTNKLSPGDYFTGSYTRSACALSVSNCRRGLITHLNLNLNLNSNFCHI